MDAEGAGDRPRSYRMFQYGDLTMSMTFSRVTALLLAASTAFGVTTMAGAAEAHGKHKHRHSLKVIIGDGYSGYGGWYASRFVGSGCGWLLDRYEMTGHPKWLTRWQRCRGIL